jgi:tetratricopeptide (TPR) repeat protein
MEGAPFTGWRWPGAPHALVDPPRVAQWALQNAGATLEIQNLAFGGNRLSQNAQDALDEVLDHPARYRPAAILLYAGHIEELPKDRPPRQAHAERAQRYGAAVRAIATRVHALKVPLLVGLPVSNLADLPPAISECPQEPGCWAPVEKAAAALKAGDAEGALALLDPLLAPWPENGLVRWERGRALEALGRREEAQAMYDEAADLDGAGMRVDRPMLDELRRVCADGLATCLDLRPELLARYGRLGRELFEDVHHPNGRLYRLLGFAFARALAQELDLNAPALPDVDRPPADLDTGADRVRRGVDLNVAGYTLLWTLFAKPALARDAYLGLARARLDDAEHLTPGPEGPQRYAFWRCLLHAQAGEAAEARRWADAALQKPREESTERVLEREDVRRILHDAGVEF